MDPSDTGQGRRATFLSFLFALVGMGAVLVILFAACGGLTAYVIAVIAGTAALGYAHYLLWGRSLNREVAGEREDAALRDEFERFVDEGNGPEEQEGTY